MSKRIQRLLNKQSKVKIIARSYDHQRESLIWWAALAAAGAAYLFSFFFGFTGGRAPAGS